MLGKLKRTLKEKCPECRSLLQLREIEHNEVRGGIPVTVSKEYIACSNKHCAYERETEQKRIRRQEEEFA